MERSNSRRAVRSGAAIAVILTVALMHAFRVGSYLEGDLFNLYYSFASDILIPIAAYFLLVLNEINWANFLRKGWVKAGLVVGAAVFAEILQGFGIPLLGSTFDPLDLLMYPLGAAAALLLDRFLIALLSRGRESR